MKNEFEIVKFTAPEIEEAVSSLDALQDILISLLVNKCGVSRADANVFKKHIAMSKHALIIIYDRFLDEKGEFKSCPTNSGRKAL